MKSIHDLIEDARKEALEIIDEHREILISLGLTGKMNSLDVSRMLSEAIEKADRKTIRPLFRLLCATNILGGLTAWAVSEDGEEARGAYLAPFWHGVLSCENWMDEDHLLSVYKEIRKHEFAATIGGEKRRSKEDDVVERLTPTVRAEIANGGVSLMKACKVALKGEGYKADRIVNALALKVVDPELNEALETADKLWSEGDQGSHIVMRNQMFDTFFPPSEIALCPEGEKLIRDDLKKKLNDLAKKKYNNCQFGNKAVKLEENPA